MMIRIRLFLVAALMAAIGLALMAQPKAEILNAEEIAEMQAFFAEHPAPRPKPAAVAATQAPVAVASAAACP